MNAGARQSLLLVDADPQSLRVLDVSLKKAGYDVLTANSGENALALLAEHPIDLVISDTHMPQMDGFELCRRIKERQDWARIPFIFLSSRKTIEDKIRGLEIGVEDYLIKPVYIKEITTRVRMLLQRRERERLESRRDTRTRFAGELADIGIVDLVQTIEVNRKSGIVHIANKDGRRGAIYFRDGRVIDAEAGRLAGNEAVYRLFAWNDGTFEVEFKSIRRRDVVELSSQALLMEGMRRLDEWTRLLETLPPLETVFEVDYYVLAERLADIPDEVNTILRLLDGRRSLLQVIDDSDFPDLEAVSIVVRLHGDRVIYEAQGDKPAHAEPRQTRMGRLERWLSESPWANAERTPTLVQAEVDEGQSEERSTLTGYSASQEGAPAVPGRASTTKPGMSVAPEELPDLRTMPPLGRTLHGFAPVRGSPLPAAPNLGSVTPALPLIGDLDKTPSPRALGAQPFEEMRLPAVAATNEVAQVDASPTKEPAARSDETPGIDASEQITSQSSLDEATRLALLDSAGNETSDERFYSGDGEADDDDELDQATLAPSDDDAATPEELASLAEILGGQSDDPTPVRTLQAFDEGEQAQGAAGLPDDEDAAEATIPAVPVPSNDHGARQAPVSAPPVAVGATVLLDARPLEAPPLGESPEQLKRRSGSARKDGPAESFVDEPPSRNGLKLAVIFSVAVAVGGVVVWVGIKNTASGRALVAQSKTVEVPKPQGAALPAVDLPATKPVGRSPASTVKPVEPIGNRAPPPADLGRKPEVSAKAVAKVIPKEPASKPVVANKKSASPAVATNKSPATPAVSAESLAQAIETCKKAYAGEKYAPIMDACGKALQASPQEPQVMVMLAHAELDRGHSPAALRYAKQAVAADPKAAEAYVFIGQVEQERGRKAAAKAAYVKYLDLAPTGRFAKDLRAIVKNL